MKYVYTFKNHPIYKSYNIFIGNIYLTYVCEKLKIKIISKTDIKNGLLNIQTY